MNHDFFERFVEIISDPTNEKIERHTKAGSCENGYIYMHNGVKIYKKSYYDNFSDILIINKGVHEPQEEYVFSVVLDKINKKTPVMIELGSYWGFYSLSFLEKIPYGKCFLIEPGEEEIQEGIKNFSLNNREGVFIKDKIGHSGINIDNFLNENKIDHVEILHSDIQGYELEMLYGAKKSISEKKIDYIFVSTHNNNIHYECLAFLKQEEYHIICSVDLEQTYCADGIIIAQSSLTEKINMKFADKKIDIPKYTEILNNLINENLHLF